MDTAPPSESQGQNQHKQHNNSYLQPKLRDPQLENAIFVPHMSSVEQNDCNGELTAIQSG